MGFDGTWAWCTQRAMGRALQVGRTAREKAQRLDVQGGPQERRGDNFTGGGCSRFQMASERHLILR